MSCPSVRLSNRLSLEVSLVMRLRQDKGMGYAHLSKMCHGNKIPVSYRSGIAVDTGI